MRKSNRAIKYEIAKKRTAGTGTVNPPTYGLTARQNGEVEALEMRSSKLRVRHSAKARRAKSLFGLFVPPCFSS